MRCRDPPVYSPFVRWNNLYTITNWTWEIVYDDDNNDTVMSYDLVEGKNTLVIANRENGAMLDRIYITAEGDTPN